MPKDAAVDRMRIFTRLHYKFIESWRSGEQYLRMLPKLLNRIVSFGQVLPRQFFQSNFAVNRHEDIRHQRNQRLIRTNVRRRFLPPDVLLPRGERENESALAITICGLANQPTWHLADKLLAGGDYTTVRSSEPKRNSEGLRFHRNYVRLARRFYDAKRNRFGNRDHQQSTALVRKLSNAANIFDRPKKVRRLNQNARRLCSNRPS